MREEPLDPDLDKRSRRRWLPFPGSSVYGSLQLLLPLSKTYRVSTARFAHGGIVGAKLDSSLPYCSGVRHPFARFSSREKYCHDGGMAFAPSSRTDATAGRWGSMIGTFGPLYGTLRSC
jgi:hypothetical protein